MPRDTSPIVKRIVTEDLNPNLGFYYTVKKTLYAGETDYQKIELVDTEEFGKVLLLDGITQVVEKNDYQYHEPMVHPAFCAHPNPQSVLVIGGGDGCILREVLKYSSVKNIEFVELDADVIKFSRKYLGALHNNSFDDPRVIITVCDGRSFIESRRGEFDIVIMDMTDPFGPSRMLYTKEFFSLVKRSLKGPKGQFVMHTQSPITRPVAFNCIQRTLNSVFGTVNIFYLYIQMYATLWSISVCSEKLDHGVRTPQSIDKRLATAGISGCKVYTGEAHRAMLTPYPYLRDILAKKTRIITDRNPDFPDSF